MTSSFRTEVLKGTMSKTRSLSSDLLDDLLEYKTKTLSSDLEKIHNLNAEISSLSQSKDNSVNVSAEHIQTKKLYEEEIKHKKEKCENALDEISELKVQKNNLMHKQNNLEMKNKDLENQKLLLEAALLKKKDTVEKKREKNKIFSDTLRKILALEIIPQKESEIKIIFNNLVNNKSANITIDFNQTNIVSSIEPNAISLEKANHMLSSSKSFYKFLKNIREELKEKIKNL